MEIEEQLDDWSLWCRLCAKEDPKTNMNIFLKDESQAGIDVTPTTITSHMELNIVQAMEQFFFVHVKRDEELPKMLCSECYALTTSLLKFTERVVRVQRMFETIQNSTSEQCPKLDLHAIRVKHELLDANRVHLVMSGQQPEVHYLDSQTGSTHLENSITNPEPNTIDPLEFVQVKLKTEKSESLMDIDDTVTTISNEKLNTAKTERNGSASVPDKLKKKVRLSPVKMAAKEKHCLSTQSACKNKWSDNKKNSNENSLNSGDTDGNIINCTECGRKFKRERDYHVHLKFKHNKDIMKDRQFTCTECSRSFPTRGRLKQHVDLHSPLEVRKNFECEICQHKFVSNLNLQSHIKTVHMKLHNSFVCEECGIVTHSKSELHSHLLTHTDSTPHVCKVCGNAYKSNNNLKRHMETHNPKIMCPECGLQLRTKSTLRNHLLVHSDEMKHKCEQCGRAFKTDKTLKNHLITHTGLRPYICEFCNQTFSFGSSCRLHKKKLHPKELAELEASGAPKTFTRNIPKLAVLKAMTKATGIAQRTECEFN